VNSNGKIFMQKFYCKFQRELIQASVNFSVN